MNLQGKRLLLTGATGGIGAACARALAESGAQLVLTARDGDALDALRVQLPGQGHVCEALDLLSAPARHALVTARGGELDGLVNCAGSNHFGLLEDQPEAVLEQMVALNLTAPMLLVRALLPALRRRPSVIVNIGSSFGAIGYAGYAGYCASKFALRGFSEALGRELADSSVRVCYLSPRATQTPMNDDCVQRMNRELGNTMDSPERVAHALVRQLRRDKARVAIGWPERFFSKLNALFPALVDRGLGGQLARIKAYATEQGGA